MISGMGQTRHDGSRGVVTLAALYGAGGSVVGPRVAERLGVPFLDRQIPESVAKRTGLPEDAVEDVDDAPRSAAKRLVSTLGRASTISGGPAGTAESLDLQERKLRSYMEEFLARAAETGCVALGRGGMVVLRTAPTALHVQLAGPRDARVRQGMEIEGVDRATAERRQEDEDAARRGYLRRVYGVDGDDPSLYHMVLDSTTLELDVCVELIVTASRARIHDPRPTPSE
jgi:hypothetical protein